MNVKNALLGLLAIGGALSAAGKADIGLLRELVAIPSASADIQAVNRASEFLKTRLEAEGLFCTMETTPEGREVLYGSTVPGAKADFILSCHLDVVPAVNPEQYVLGVDGDKLVGRGVNDDKGACVAVVQALRRLKGKVSVGVIFGPDEEIGGMCTGWMVKKGYQPRKMAIVIDGSSTELVYAQKGQSYIEVLAKGRGGHSARPWVSDDSIGKICEAYLKIRSEWDRLHPLAKDKWSDVLTATVLGADGGAPNRIPDTARLLLNLRSVDPESICDVERIVRDIPGLEVNRLRHSSPCMTDPNHPLMVALRQTMCEVYGRDVQNVRMPAATDARHFVDCAVPVAILGCKGGDAHAPTEWESAEGIENTSEILVRFLSGFAVPGGLPRKLKTAVYVGNGPTGMSVVEWVRLVNESPEMELLLVDAEGVRKGVLAGADLLAMPGGRSARIKKDLGEEGIAALKDFLRRGGGYVGTCAGCSLLLDAKAHPDRGLDIVPYRRSGYYKGHGFSQLVISEEGAAAMGVAAGAREIWYDEGPILVHSENATAEMNFKVLGTYGIDLGRAGEDPKMTGCAALVAGTFGKGRVVATACHPEFYPMTLDIIRGMIRFATGREVTFPTRCHKKGAPTIGYYSLAGSGIEAAETVVALDSAKNLNFACLEGFGLRLGSLAQVDAVLIPSGEPFAQAFTDEVRKALSDFAARGGLVVSWGENVRHLPVGGKACANKAEALSAVGNL